MKKPATWLLFVVACAIGLLSQSATPKLTDAQKLRIRSAQVDFFTAKTNLEATPAFKQFEAAQHKVDEVVSEVLKESAVDPSKYQLQPSLEFKDIQPPPAPKPSEKK